MSVNKFIVFLLVSFGVMTSAVAAGKTRELSLDANYVNVQGQDSASFLNISIGQFLTPQFVVVTELSSQRNFGYTGTSIGLGGKYYFMDGFKGDLVPFAGVGIALRQSATPADSNHASTQYDVNLGLAFFMADNTTLDAKIRSLNFNDSSPSITVFSAGFTHRF
jgi:hypothetical protein